MIFKNFVYVLKRFKTSSILNILGLSAAFTVFLTLMAQVSYDFNFNKNFKDADDIYILSTYYPFINQTQAWYNTQTGDNAITKSSHIDAYTTLNEGEIRIYNSSAEPELAIEEPLTRVRGNFIQVFQPTVVEGDLSVALSEGNNIALSESIAKKLFPTESAIGKTVLHYYSKKPYTIQAVIKDFPKNCTLYNGVFSYLPEQEQEEASHNIYLKIQKNNIEKVENFLKCEAFMGEGSLKYMEENPEFQRITSIVPFTDIHLKYPTKGFGDINITLSLMAIAILTLVISYINYINFSVAMAPSRVKTLTIQRIFGMPKHIQIIIIAIESALFSLIALAIAFVAVQFIKDSSIVELFSVDLSTINNLALIIYTILCTLVIGFFIGLYPAQYISRFNVLNALKGGALSIKTSKLRGFLIVFQLIAAITLITITSFIKMQRDYMVNYSWGIEKENIVYIDLQNKGIDYKSFTAELMKDPRITDYTLSQFIPGHVYMGWGRNFNGKQVNIQSWPVADNYLDFFGATVIKGDNFPTLNNPDKAKLIFNEAFLNKYDFKAEDVLGKNVFAFSGNAEVVGIVKDINFESLKFAIRPMAFVTLGDSRNTILYLKLSGNNIKEVISIIDKTWNAQTKETLDLKFLDESLEKLYKNESNLGKLVGIFSFITILIAVMGIYGLITFNVKFRKKEIAIRKINGANEVEILKLLNKGILMQLCIAFVIAKPIAYFIVDKWLSNFAYRTPIYWYVFALSGLFVLIITLVSISWQSYKAAITNPVESLKSE